MRLFIVSLVLLAILLALETPAAWAGQYSKLVVFGDSLSDVGNNPAPPPYYMGRSSNGPNWVDRLAANLGTPPLVASLSGGSDFAYAGAETTYSGYRPNLGSQVTSYLGTVPAGGADPNALYVIWMGSNDFLKTFLERDHTVQACRNNTSAWVDKISNAVNTLHANGAVNFLVPNLVPLGNVPQMSTQSSATKADFNSAVSAFNTELFGDLGSIDASHPDLSIRLFDTYSLFNDVLANPGSYGLVNVTSPAMTTPGADASKYLFWDTIHPTAVGHALLAEAIPEPGAATLLAVGALTLLGWAGICRRAS
jgi:phospholipase/lecithinase/hemolysin